METFARGTTAPRSDERPTGFSSKRGMERMNNGENYESKLWSVLTKEHLVDLSQFHRSGFFDEVPLYSRDTDIDFLAQYPTDRANSILIGFALKFLKSVVSYEQHRGQYFAAITIWEPAEGDRVVPNLFVWSGPTRSLQKKLHLERARTSFARKIKQMVVAGQVPRNGFEVFEDATTDPGEVRVFISFSQPPYKSFVPLVKFVNTKAHTS